MVDGSQEVQIREAQPKLESWNSTTLETHLAKWMKDGVRVHLNEKEFPPSMDLADIGIYTDEIGVETEQDPEARERAGTMVMTKAEPSRLIASEFTVLTHSGMITAEGELLPMGFVTEETAGAPLYDGLVYLGHSHPPLGPRVFSPPDCLRMLQGGEYACIVNGLSNGREKYIIFRTADTRFISLERAEEGIRRAIADETSVKPEDVSDQLVNQTLLESMMVVLYKEFPPVTTVLVQRLATTPYKDWWSIAKEIHQLERIYDRFLRGFAKKHHLVIYRGTTGDQHVVKHDLNVPLIS